MPDRLRTTVRHVAGASLTLTITAAYWACASAAQTWAPFGASSAWPSSGRSAPYCSCQSRWGLRRWAPRYAVLQSGLMHLQPCAPLRCHPHPFLARHLSLQRWWAALVLIVCILSGLGAFGLWCHYGDPIAFLLWCASIAAPPRHAADGHLLSPSRPRACVPSSCDASVHACRRAEPRASAGSLDSLARPSTALVQRSVWSVGALMPAFVVRSCFCDGPYCHAPCCPRMDLLKFRGIGL